MAFDNNHLSRTLDRADRGLDHCPPDEPRERPPHDPRGTVRLGFVAEEERGARTSSHACAVTDEARARAILGLDVAGFYLRNSLAYLRATGDLEAAHVLVDVINATALLKSATESRAALARVHLEVAVDVADELDRRGGPTAPSTSCSTGSR